MGPKLGLPSVFLSPPKKVIDLGIQAAKMSVCQKSKRGAVVWTVRGGTLLGQFSRNTPPGDACDGSPSCRRDCGKVCVHAEMAAIAKATRDPRMLPLSSCEILHVKVVDGDLVPSGPPSCIDCAKLIAAVELRAVWLYHANGWRVYEPPEFYGATTETLKLYRAER